MFYFRDANSGSIEAMYGSQVIEPLGTELVGSFNLFLSMSNWLRLVNVTGNSTDVELEVLSSAGQLSTRSITLSPYQTVDLGIHEQQFNTSANSYGLVIVRSPTPGGIHAELLRFRQQASSNGTETDFAAPTPLR